MGRSSFLRPSIQRNRALAWHLEQCRLPHELYEWPEYPQRVHSSTCQPRAAVQSVGGPHRGRNQATAFSSAAVTQMWRKNLVRLSRIANPLILKPTLANNPTMDFLRATRARDLSFADCQRDAGFVKKADRHPPGWSGAQENEFSREAAAIRDLR
jgi:hypothetical protein